jgi:formate hydrogenlyase subunit 6/NADH:ubiquinone oxidoreductase subunit I
METYTITKEEMKKFLRQVSVDQTLIAPLKKGLVRYQEITKEEVKDIYLEKNAYFPVKEYFFRKHEKIFDFKKSSSKTKQDFKLTVPETHIGKRVFFGLRRCDLNGIMHQDKIFTEVVHDPYYHAQRENSILLGYHCNEAPSKFCFCGTLDLKEFFDVMFYEKDSLDAHHFVAEIGTDKGHDFIKKYQHFFKKHQINISAEEKKIKNADRLFKTDISKLYDNPEWKKDVDQCLSCAACTNLCPTCYCFEFHDELKTDGSGQKMRSWSSCQVQDFTRVAGEHVFRQKREERFKHRIFHQLQYFKDRYGINLCVGCGRCIEGCPTRIDFVKTLNDMK